MLNQHTFRIQKGAFVATGDAITTSAQLDWCPGSAATSFVKKVNANGLFVIPETWLGNQSARDTNDYHITLLYAKEIKQCSLTTEALRTKFSSIKSGWTDLTLGHAKAGEDEVLFKVIDWPEANTIRAQLGLPAKDFHITIGIKHTDLHDVDKSTTSLLQYPSERNYSGSTHSSAHVTAERLHQIVESALTAGRTVMLARKPSVVSVDRSSSLCKSALSWKDLQTKDRAALLDMLAACSMKAGLYEEALVAADPMKQIPGMDHRADIRLADAFLHLSRWEEAKRAYWRALRVLRETQQSGIVAHIQKGLTRCAKHGSLYAHLDESPDLAELWPSEHLDSYHLLCRSIVTNLNVEVSDLRPNVSKTRQYVYANEAWHKLPRNFSWIVPFRLAVMSTPRRQEDILALAHLNIGLVITATKETPLPSAWFSTGVTQNVFLPVDNYHPPSLEQVQRFMYLCNQHFHVTSHSATKQELPSAVLVHCGGGVGRAGTFAACYLARHGARVLPRLCNACEKMSCDSGGTAVKASTCHGEPCPNATPPELAGDETIDRLRRTRPGSIETKAQEAFVGSYVDFAWKLYSSPASTVEMPRASKDEESTQLCLDIPSAGVSVQGRPGKPRFLVLVGLPGSGKSSFCHRLGCTSPEQMTPSSWVRISQDELGSRRACEDLLGTCIKRGSRVVLDRCNANPDDRLRWLDIAFRPKDAVAVYFTASADICARRAASRLDHPTIPVGNSEGIRRIINQHAKAMTLPSVMEGFAGIYHVSSFADANSLADKLRGKASADSKEAATVPQPLAAQRETFRLPDFYKFPRTSHLFNCGGSAVTEDDIVIGEEQGLLILKEAGANLTVEEKVDGANLGISISADQKLLAQNRSHYVNRKDHPQFETIDSWLHRHNQRLRHLLGGSGGQLILYGEWMAAKHSVYYDRLPDTFLAFDLFDITQSRFFSRKRFRERMAEANDLQVHEPQLFTVPAIDPLCWVGLKTKQAWVEWLRKLTSQCSTQVAEGVYIRVDEGDWLKNRVKLVRDDFICGNQHWSKHTITKNIILR